MAEEQLELKKSLAKAEEEERIYEQMNNEELFYTPTCLQAQRLPIFPVSSLLPANVTKDTNRPVNTRVSCNDDNNTICFLKSQGDMFWVYLKLNKIYF